MADSAKNSDPRRVHTDRLVRMGEDGEEVTVTEYRRLEVHPGGVGPLEPRMVEILDMQLDWLSGAGADKSAYDLDKVSTAIHEIIYGLDEGEPHFQDAIDAYEQREFWADDRGRVGNISERLKHIPAVDVSPHALTVLAACWKELDAIRGGEMVEVESELGRAWLVAQVGSEVKLCPECGGLALEGEVDCKACGHRPEDDHSWRIAGRRPKTQTQRTNDG